MPKKKQPPSGVLDPEKKAKIDAFLESLKGPYQVYQSDVADPKGGFKERFSMTCKACGGDDIHAVADTYDSGYCDSCSYEQDTLVFKCHGCGNAVSINTN